jgi:hypothetical protein
MNAIPPDFHAMGHSALDADVRLTVRWTALAGAARVVAQLADPQAMGAVDAAVIPPVALDALRGGRRVLIEQGIEDMLAMMEPGLTALLDVHQRGGQTAPAANALWQEFLRARRGLAALAPIGPMQG